MTRKTLIFILFFLFSFFLFGKIKSALAQTCGGSVSCGVTQKQCLPNGCSQYECDRSLGNCSWKDVCTTASVFNKDCFVQAGSCVAPACGPGNCSLGNTCAWSSPPAPTPTPIPPTPIPGCGACDNNCSTTSRYDCTSNKGTCGNCYARTGVKTCYDDCGNSCTYDNCSYDTNCGTNCGAPPPTPLPSCTSYNYWNEPDWGATLVVGQTYHLRGWAIFCDGCGDPKNMYAVDLHQCQPPGTTDNCKYIGGANIKLYRSDTTAYCGGNSGYNGWDYYWTVPANSLLGQQTLWSVAINTPEKVNGVFKWTSWKRRDVNIVTPTPTPTSTPTPTPTPTPANSPPDAPTLFSPSSGSTCQNTNLTLSWNAISNWGACYPTQNNQYKVYLKAGDSNPDTLVATLGSGTTSWSASNLFPGATYYWKVVASNGCSNLDASSSVWSFTTAPSGSFQLSPSSVSIRLGESAPGAYRVDPNSPATLNQITFTGYNNLITVDPTQSNNSPGNIAIIANSTTTGTTTITGTAYLNPGSCPLPTKQIPVSVVAPGPWWQTKDGDVHAKGDIASHIPAIAAVDNKYLSLTGDGGSPGVVSYGSTLSLGSGSVSKSDFFWQAKTDKGSKVNFDYLKNRLKVNTNNTLPGNGYYRDIPSEGGTYFADCSLSLSGGTITNGQKVVIFATGDVTVNGDIIVNQGGFFALIVKGQLTFTGGVQNAQGFYLSNGDMTIQASNNKFQGEGSFISWGDIIFNRNGQDIDYNKTPAEFFVFRPDLLVNAPKDFLFHPFVFQEVAP